MKVAELIAALQQFPADALVLVDGFDSWQFDHCAAPVLVDVVPVEPMSHGPSFVENEEHSLRHYTPTGPAIRAVHLSIGSF